MHVETALTREGAISHDTWLHRIARAAIVRPVVGTRVEPNHLTTLRLATGIAAAGAFAVGETPWPELGGGVFLLSMLLDRADGDLARMTGKTTPGGHTYDLIVDAVANAVAFLGLGFGLRSGGYGPAAALMGLAAGAAVLGVLWLTLRVERAAGQRAAEPKGLAGFDADDLMLAVPLAAWLDWREPVLLGAAVGAPLFLVSFAWRFRRALKASGRRTP
jgi:phosphatidylglycerophosphate synthase